MDTPKHKNTCLGGHKINSFGIPFLGRQNYILSLSVLGLEVEKINLK